MALKFKWRWCNRPLVLAVICVVMVYSINLRQLILIVMSMALFYLQARQVYIKIDAQYDPYEGYCRAVRVKVS